MGGGVVRRRPALFDADKVGVGCCHAGDRSEAFTGGEERCGARGAQADHGPISLSEAAADSRPLLRRDPLEDRLDQIGAIDFQSRVVDSDSRRYHVLVPDPSVVACALWGTNIDRQTTHGA